MTSKGYGPKESANKYVLLFLCFVLFPVQVCFANPITFPRPLDASTTLIVIGVNCTVDFLIILGAYFFIRRIQLLRTGDFIVYFALVVIGGFLIDEFVLYYFIRRYDFPLLLVFPAGFALALLLLSGYNYLLAKGFFRLTMRHALKVGIAMGILANPVLYLFPREAFLSTHYQHQVNWLEGKAALGMVATAIRTYAQEHPNAAPPKSLADLGFKAEDLKGRYFNEDNISFEVESMNPLRYVVTAAAPNGFSSPFQAATFDQDAKWTTIKNMP